MMTDPNTGPNDRPDQPCPGLDLGAELAAVISAATDPQAAAGAVLAVLRGFGSAVGRPQPTLADFLAATAAHLRAHSLCEVTVTGDRSLQLSRVAEGQEGWAIAGWAESLHAPVALSAWNHDSHTNPARATVSATFSGPTGPVPVQVWDVVPGAAGLLGGHLGVTVSAEQLRAWMATRATGAANTPGGGERS